MLDYPRVFEKEHVLAIRTFFWWGHFCTTTLHVKGQFMAPVIEKITRGFSLPTGNFIYVSLSGNEWNHDVTGTDYHRFTGLEQADLIHAGKAHFLKLSVKTELNTWEIMEKEWRLSFRALIKLAEL